MLLVQAVQVCHAVCVDMLQGSGWRLCLLLCSGVEGVRQYGDFGFAHMPHQAGSGACELLHVFCSQLFARPAFFAAGINQQGRAEEVQLQRWYGWLPVLPCIVLPCTLRHCLHTAFHGVFGTHVQSGQPVTRTHCADAEKATGTVAYSQSRQRDGVVSVHPQKSGFAAGVVLRSAQAAEYVISDCVQLQCVQRIKWQYVGVEPRVLYAGGAVVQYVYLCVCTTVEQQLQQVSAGRAGGTGDDSGSVCGWVHIGCFLLSACRADVPRQWCCGSCQGWGYHVRGYHVQCCAAQHDGL